MVVAPIRPSARDAIVRAGVELLAQNPGAALADVAARAGVGRATVHRHFPARDDLLRALAIDALDATDAACADLDDAPTAVAALERMFEALVPLGPRYAFLARCEIDDDEIDGYLMTQDEIILKTKMWEKVNADYLKAKAEKEERERQEAEEAAKEVRTAAVDKNSRIWGKF